MNYRFGGTNTINDNQYFVRIDHTFSVWQRVVPEPTTVMLGPLSYEESPPPASAVLRSMYGIVVVPMRGVQADN